MYTVNALVENSHVDSIENISKLVEYEFMQQ